MKIAITVFIALFSLIASFQFNQNIKSYRQDTRFAMSNVFSSFSKNLFGSKSVTSNKNKETIDVLKSSIILKSKSTSNGVKASNQIKIEIQELVKQLEIYNNQISKVPLTSNPAVDGLWDLIYTTNNGSSAGKIGPFIGKVTQDIKFSNKLYENNVELINENLFKASLVATWEELKSANKWKVQFQTIQFKLFGIPIVNKSLNGTTGIWRLSYIDDTMRILYAIGGKNTIAENIYILTKSKK
eukprot:gene5483-7592_t